MTTQTTDRAANSAQDQWASAALILASALWAGNFITGRAFRGAVDPEMLNLLRWIVASVAFLPFAGRKAWRARRDLARHWRWILGLGLTGVIGFQHGTYTALTLTPVANAALLLATTPMLILASSAAMGEAKLDLARGAAVVLSLLGVAVILGEGDPLAVVRLHLGAGDLWLLFAVSCWTIYTQMLRRAPKSIASDVALLAAMLVSLPILLGLALWQSETDVLSLPPLAWAGVAYVGLGAALAAFLAWGYGVTHKGPDAAGLYINLIPVFSIALAWLVLGEGISGGQATGAGIIVLSLLLGAGRKRATLNEG